MKMTFRLEHGKTDFLCAVNELVTETLLSLCMLWLQLHWKSFRILLEPHLYRLLRGHKICTAVQFTTELEAHAICQLGRQEHQAGQRFPWQQERHWKEYFKKIVITVSLLLLSHPQPSHCPYNVIDAPWWVATPCQDLLNGCWLTVSSPALWQVLFFVLQGVKPPSSPAKNWWGTDLVTDYLTRWQVVLGYM